MSKNSGSHSFEESALLQARNLSAARSDLPHYIFPKSNFSVDEHLITSVKNSLYMMVFNIERSILRHSSMENRIMDRSLSYPILIESGLLNDRNIIDAALSLFHFQKLFLNNSDIYAELPEKLTQHENIKVRNNVQTLSLAHSRFKSLELGNYYELPPEDLQRLSWRIVATFEVIDKTIDTAMIDATTRWLEAHSEAESITASSRKLIYLLRDEDVSEYWQFKPEYAALFVALLEQEISVDRHVIITILADRSPLLCALLFRAVNMDLSLALDNILKIFQHNDKNDHNQFIAQINDEYLNISPAEACEKITQWSASLVDRE